MSFEKTKYSLNSFADYMGSYDFAPERALVMPNLNMPSIGFPGVGMPMFGVDVVVPPEPETTVDCDCGHSSIYKDNIERLSEVLDILVNLQNQKTDKLDVLEKSVPGTDLELDVLEDLIERTEEILKYMKDDLKKFETPKKVKLTPKQVFPINMSPKKFTHDQLFPGMTTQYDSLGNPVLVPQGGPVLMQGLPVMFGGKQQKYKLNFNINKLL